MLRTILTILWLRSTGALQCLCKAIETGTAHQRLFVVDADQIWGAAPDNTLPDDEIFFLIGCSAPVMLRRTSDNEYRLVGECYCNGVMDGDALQPRSEKGVDNKTLP